MIHQYCKPFKGLKHTVMNTDQQAHLEQLEKDNDYSRLIEEINKLVKLR